VEQISITVAKISEYWHDQTCHWNDEMEK
jgi:hypothetical protein